MDIWNKYASNAQLGMLLVSKRLLEHVKARGTIVLYRALVTCSHRSITMGGKAKPTKHTSKEIAKKRRKGMGFECGISLEEQIREAQRCRNVFEANCNRGGGGSGAAARLDAKCSYKCYVCLCAQVSPLRISLAGSARYEPTIFARRGW
eukprot:1072620-Rhodomonas_salina.1